MDLRTAIITGASSGIGMETAYALARRGYHVVLAARRVEKLNEVAARCRELFKANAAGGGGVAEQPRSTPKRQTAPLEGGTEPDSAIVIPTDVADSHQVQALVEETVRTLGRLDVMVNNAGYGLFARVDQTSDDEMRRLMDVNFMGLFYGCRAAAAVMMRQQSGHIFNLASVAGKRGTPFHGAYCASKFAIVGLSDCLRVEMAPHNVRVTTICPSLTQTEFFDQSIHGRSKKSKYLRPERMTPASAIAGRIAATIGKKKPEIVFTPGGKLICLINAVWPGLADRLMAVYMKSLEE